jgi:hypothetical protein
MKVGFSNTTLELSGKVGTGTCQNLQDRRKLTSKEKKFRLIIMFFDSHGVVHKEFLSPGVIINQLHYLEALDCLRKRMMRVRMEIADWILQASLWQCPL